MTDQDNQDKIEILLTRDGKTYGNHMTLGGPPLFMADFLARLMAEAVASISRGVPSEERMAWADRLLLTLNQIVPRLVDAQRVRAGFGPVEPNVQVTRVTVHPELISDAVPYRIEGHGNGTATLHVSPALEVRAFDLVAPDRRTPKGVTVAEVMAALGDQP